MPINTGSVSALMLPDLDNVYVEEGQARDLEYVRWMNVQTMDYNPTKDMMVSGLGQMPSKAEGSRFAEDEPMMGGTKTYTAEPFGLAFKANFEPWYDEQYGVFTNATKQLRKASLNRQEVASHAVLNNAFSTSYVGFNSGESLCSTSHTNLDGSTSSNRPSVDVTISQTAIQDGINSMEGTVDERGLPMPMVPRAMIVDKSLKWLARELLGSPQKPGSANNDVNAIVNEDMTVLISHYLTTSTYWFMLAAKGEHDLNFKWRNHPMFDGFDDPNIKAAVFTSYQRHTAGYGSWRGVYGSSGA